MQRVKVINKSDSYTYSCITTHYCPYPIVGNLLLHAFASRKFIVTLLMNTMTVSGERNTPHGSRGEACDKICGFCVRKKR